MLTDDAERLADLMMELADLFAATLADPSDMRAWDHLLTYAPRDALERRLWILRSLDKGLDG